MKQQPIAGITGSRRSGHAIVRVTRFGDKPHTHRYRVSLRRWALLRDRLVGGIGPYRCSGSWMRNSLDVSVWADDRT